MRVYSFYKKGLDLLPVEIEISLVPGVPAFHVTGLPDAVIKESILRLKSALRHQGFEMPTREQVIFHLRPTHERKSSQGLDLALAAAYLFKTGQLPTPAAEGERLYLYGELSLEGSVTKPDDLDFLEGLGSGELLITGPGSCALPRAVASSLKDLGSLKWCEGEFSEPPVAAGASIFDSYEFCEKSAQMLLVAATGEHNAFLAGPAGSGKTTFARVLHELLRPPTMTEWRRISKIERLAGRASPAVGPASSELSHISARPFMAPHHSATDVALLGGGVPATPGEITRAQHGMLLLDEFLEFSPHVVESLREPIERHEITILRKGVKVHFPADFMLVATTNLCPCGDFKPSEKNKCQYSQVRCRSFFEKLSLPLLDRFDVVTFTHTWGYKKAATFAEIRDRVQAAQKFALEMRGQLKMNSRLSALEVEPLISPFALKNLLPDSLSSHRRRLSLLRVARTIADLAADEIVESRHLKQAEDLTHRPFLDFRRAYN